MQRLFDSYYEKCLLNHQSKVVPQAPVILNSEEICIKLGISVQTMIKWRAKGKVPFFRIGSSIRYDLNKVLEALEVSKAGKGIRNV